MKILRYLALLFFMNLTTGVASASTTQCEAVMSVTWVYNAETKLSEIVERSDINESVKLHFDFGFLKFLNESTENSTLFKQTGIRKNGEDPLDFTVRYESTIIGGIEKLIAFITDPMCRSYQISQLSVVKSLDMGFYDTVYNCRCLSPVKDSNNFIYVE